MNWTMEVSRIWHGWQTSPSPASLNPPFLIQLVENLNCHKTTKYLVRCYLAEYISRQSQISCSQLQPLAVTCILIAIKVNHVVNIVQRVIRLFIITRTLALSRRIYTVDAASAGATRTRNLAVQTESSYPLLLPRNSRNSSTWHTAWISRPTPPPPGVFLSAVCPVR